MNASPIQWIARARSIRQALGTLDAVAGHALLILPTTRGALMLARELSAGRECYVMEGPISEHCRVANRSSACARLQLSPRNSAGQPQLPRTIVSFPDQIIGNDLSFAWLPFLGTRYSFCVIEALLALRHRPQVFALRTCSPSGDFSLVEVAYADLLDAQARMASVQALMGRLLGPLESELENHPRTGLPRAGLRRNPKRTGDSGCARS